MAVDQLTNIQLAAVERLYSFGVSLDLVTANTCHLASAAVVIATLLFKIEE